MVLVNAWLLYSRVHVERRTNGKMHEGEKALPFAEFRSEVYLCRECTLQYKRPSNESVDQQLRSKKKKGPTVHVPPKNVRMDGIFHFPVVNTVRQRCKLPTCNHLSYIQCEKCEVHLCLNKNNKCFKSFHVN